MGTNNLNLLAMVGMKKIIDFCEPNFMGILYPSCPGLRLKILPVRLLRWLSGPCRMIGNAATAITRFLWKHWLTGNDSKALAIRRPTGYTWEKRWAAGGWTGTTISKAWRSRRFMFTLLHPDFVKNWRDCKRRTPWDLRLAFLNRIQQENFDT